MILFMFQAYFVIAMILCIKKKGGDRMDMFYEFLDRAKRSGWNIEESGEQVCHIPAVYEGRLGEFEDIIKKFRAISNPRSTAWFVVAECINNTDDNKFSWNEFMKISMESCMDEDGKNAVEDWWSCHFPIVMSVGDGFYECYTLDTNEGKICYSSEPFFEEEEVIAESLDEFLGKITDGSIDLD